MCIVAVGAFAQDVEIQTPYVPTEPSTVDAMLELANPKPGDVIYDLGCGDGRIVVAAAKRYGLRGVGIDINPDRIREANENAKREGVSGLVTFRIGDLYDADLHSATIVTLYLLPEVNLKLRPKLRHELGAGARIVSHSFDLGDWKPDRKGEAGGHDLFLWVIP